MTAERRSSTRVRKFLDVEVGGVKAHTTNVSETGVQLSCPTLRLRRLREAHASDDGLRLTVTLPGGEAVSARARIAHETDYGSEFLLGIRFERFDGDGESLWRTYVSGAAGGA